MSNFEDVKKFMKTFGQKIITKPQFPDEKTMNLRFDLIKEELEELKEAINQAGGDCEYHMIDSPDGHDGFLLAVKEIGVHLESFLSKVSTKQLGKPFTTKNLLDRIQTELDLNENNILEYSNLEQNEKFPDAVTQEELLDAKKRDRDKLGSVNLRADEETNKYQSEIKKMEKDRQDLVTAIIKLKESINELNQKGRERLLEAFEKVNRKFNEVYTKLFNGGNAKLELIDSEDPLEAGLELLVSPPGKRLQSITLLSGGEQALTALSLIFAVFLSNPSPICVLDEVDAPLDDANVPRFCNLLSELTKITSTRFIIVTHHALTMSKMNRLYGVTMPEKGLSLIHI